MLIRWARFNIYLFVALALLLGVGCQSPEAHRKKQPSALRVHGETNSDATGHTLNVSIFRAQPFSMTIDKQEFLNEGSVKEARVVDVMGGYALQIQFDRKGTWLLEEYTTALRGKHIAVFGQFAKLEAHNQNEGRWLAAPLILNPIKDGLLTFTPDATRQEAEQIAQGLNNVAKERGTDK